MLLFPARDRSDDFPIRYRSTEPGNGTRADSTPKTPSRIGKSFTRAATGIALATAASFSL